MIVRRIFLLFITVLSSIQCDITNVKEFLDFIHEKGFKEYAVGALSQANIDVAKRYITGSPKFILYQDKKHLLEALDNRTIILGMGTGLGVQDVGTDYHVFSSLSVSPQAMLLAPSYDRINAPYGLSNGQADDLFNALNAAIIDMQNSDLDETIFTNYSRTDVVRAYSCRQDKPMDVINANETRGYLKEIISRTRPLRIGGIGPRDWGIHDGNYSSENPRGIYPALLDAIVDKLGKLKGSDDIPYSENITYTRKYYPDTAPLLRALLDGEIDATDVYILIDAPYSGSQQNCTPTNHSACRTEESCSNSICTYPSRPRSLMFRSTCTIASRDTKFITLKENAQRNRTTNSSSSTSTIPTPTKTRWVAFLLLFSALFGTIFLTLLILVRRKKTYRMNCTLPGGFGKFARLQEEAEPPMESMDSFDDQIVQSPRETTHSTT